MASEGEIYLYPEGIESEAVLISTYAKEVKRKIEKYGRSGRTFGGDLKTDTTSRKYIFTIDYDYIDQATLDLIYSSYALDQHMELKMYITDSTWFTNFDNEIPVVIIEPFSFVDFRTGHTTKIYKSLALDFIEV